MTAYLDSLIDTAERVEAGAIRGAPRIAWNTVLVTRRALRTLRSRVVRMEAANERLRRAQHRITFQPLPDVRREPEAIVAPGQLSIIYLAGYDEIMQSTVVSLLLESLFEHRTALRKRVPPVLTVVEEAHTFLPANRSAGDVPSLAALRRIMTEGRKFGMGAILVTQRPSQVDATALAQCNSFLAMRLINANDQTYVAGIVENLSPAEISALSGLGPGQGIVAGQTVRVPTIVQVDLDGDLMEVSTSEGSFIREAAEWKGPPRS